MPAHYHVRIGRTAFSDLDAIFSYIQRHSPGNAARVIERILTAIAGLEYFPHRFKIHRSARRSDPAVRSMVVRPFVVYYRISENPALVRVLTVRHGARRLPRSFEQEE